MVNEQKQNEEPDRLDVASEQAIATCGGDVRAALRAMILVNDYLEMELAAQYAATSYGYSRGKRKRQRSA